MVRRFAPTLSPAAPSLAALVLLGASACSGQTTPPASTENDATPVMSDDGQSSANDTVVGTFQVSLVPESQSGDTHLQAVTKLLGKVADGPTPSATVWEVQAESDGCQLLTPRVPFCDPGCGSAVCIEDDSCQAYPTAKDVGRVTVTGVDTATHDTSFSMLGVAGTYQPSAGITLAYPGVDEQGSVQISSEGGDYAPFSLETSGIAPLDWLDNDLSIEASQALELAWIAPAGTSTSTSTLHIKLDLTHHGGSKGKLECDVPDNGTFAVPAALIEPLLALGSAGFPTIIVTRQTSASTPVASGLVTLIVASQVERDVQVQGLRSCNEDGDCDVGHTCQTDLRCN